MNGATHKDIIDGWFPFTEEEVSRYVSKGYWHALTTGDLLDRNAERFPDKLAYADDLKEVTWREVKQRSDRTAIWLHRLGVRYGDFFVLQITNIVEFFYIFFGLNRLGAIPVMCIPRHRRVEVNHQVGLHRAKGIIVPVGERFDFVGMVNEFREDHPYLKVFLTAGGEAPAGWESLEDLAMREIEKEYFSDWLAQFRPSPADICTEQLSGGTTGLPKGIPRTYYDYLSGWHYLSQTRGFTDETVALAVMPITHNSSVTVAWGPVMVSAGTTVLTKLMRPQEQFALIEKRKITYVPMVPVQIKYWMEAEELMKAYDLSSLRLIGGGAQKVRPEQVKWCRERLGVSFVSGFGMSEGPMIATRPESPLDAQMFTVGRPTLLAPDVEIRLVDDENREVKQGEIGEMVIKGPLTFKGYFRDPVANAKSFDEQGFFHSGDLMSQREDGRYVVEGRKKDMIIRGGENVYPEPVEEMLGRHPKVAYAAVTGMPDAALGEKLCAFVQAVEGENFTLEEMKKYLEKAGLAIFQWPERLEVVKGWPLTGISKINKKLLRAYMTAQLFKEGVIDRTLGDEYLKQDKLALDDILSGTVEVAFTGTPL